MRGRSQVFYLDWNLNIWRCEAWKEPLGSVFDLDRIPNQRDACNPCTVAYYRNASILMHAGVAASDAVRSLARGDIGATTSSLSRRGVGLPPSSSRAADADTQDSEGPNSCESQRSLDCGL